MHQPGIDTHNEFGSRYQRRHVIERKPRRDDCNRVCRRDPLAACALLTAAPRQNTGVTCSFKATDQFSPLCLLRAGNACILPWGSGEERARSERIAAANSVAIVPPRLALDDMSALIARAEFVVGVDTGLMHLAAALSRPVVGIFCDSNPVDACPVGPGATAYRGHIGASPT